MNDFKKKSDEKRTINKYNIKAIKELIKGEVKRIAFGF